MKHYSVLKNEVIEGLNIKSDGVYVDATLGYAGDSKEVLKRIKRGFLFAFDQDEEAIKYSDAELSKIGDNYKIIYSNFKDLKIRLNDENITLVDGFIFDLGLSSPQIDDAERGFSFMKDAALDMRMDLSGELSAKMVVNEYSLDDLTRIFREYGEEDFSRPIAKTIVSEREKKEISTTLELVEVIKKSVPYKYFVTKHPERQIFQAIRIEVNNELNILENTLRDAVSMLKPGGRICVITFHSLEDRIVKNVFKSLSEVNHLVKGLPVIPDEYKPVIKLINKKPILPSELELEENSRSRSAKLRIIERL
ncbi:MAG: 16S rRNA (cytosine(1402)-N(4))-methyltransferase RsmH [bacterium]|nr:16S rRNA (cytosine(1402)-N(4))-methyltransferase RsmH [bacterium]